MKPAVSVIVPVYNTEKYLEECIQSVLNQSFTDFELLLIDDGSTDQSGLICDKYAKKDNRIRVFHKINGGVSSARNLGLDNAKGEWITFVDSDDCLKPDYLMNLYACVNAKVDLIIAYAENVMPTGEILTKEHNNGWVSDVNEVQKLADEECLKYKTGDKAVLLQTKSFDCKIFVPSRANFKCETNNKISE